MSKYVASIVMREKKEPEAAKAGVAKKVVMLELQLEQVHEEEVQKLRQDLREQRQEVRSQVGQKKELLEIGLKEELEAAKVVVAKKVKLLELEQEHKEKVRKMRQDLRGVGQEERI